MSTDTVKIPKGYMADSKGALVPKKSIKPIHLEEDALVKELAAEAEKLSEQLADFRSRAFAKIADFRKGVAERYDVERGGKKGNVTLSTFDGSLQLQVAVGDNISFGPELEAAKGLIDNCVLRWSKGSRTEIKTLVQHAFQTNKEGKIDTGAVLGLRRLEIEDEEWQRAMGAISDAVRVTSSKTYFRAYRRDGDTETKSAIPLDIANA